MALGEETKKLIKFLGLGTAGGAFIGASTPREGRTTTTPSGEKKIISRKRAALTGALAGGLSAPIGYVFGRALTGDLGTILEDLGKIPKSIRQFRRKRRVEKGMKKLKLRVIQGGKSWLPTKLSSVFPSFMEELAAIYASSR